MKRHIALLLAASLLLSCIPAFSLTAHAEGPDVSVVEPTQPETVEEPTQADILPQDEEPAPSEAPEESVPSEEPTQEEPIISLPATDASIKKSGTWGSNLRWILYTDGLLTISGVGAMANIGYTSSAPWYSYRSSITQVVIDEGVTTLEKYAFYGNTYITSVTLPDTLTTIESSAFDGCTALVSVHLGNNVTEIPSYTFDSCSKLQSINIPASVTTIDKMAFQYCTAMTSVTLSEGLLTIGEDAFYGCRSLTSLEIPDSVTEIGTSAFYNCTALTSVKLGDGLVRTGIEAFYNCDALKELTFGSNLQIISMDSFKNCESLVNLIIPDNVTEIHTTAFSGCSALTNVYLGSGITTLGSNVFRYCNALSDVWYRGTADQWSALGIYNNSNLTQASIHYMAGTYGENLYWDLSMDGTLTFSGTGPMNGGDDPFDWQEDDICSSATKLVIKPGVTSLEPYAFSGMAFTEVSLPEGLEKLDACAFYNCYNLTSVTLPASLKEYGTSAFGFCSALTRIDVAPGNTNFYTDSKGVLYSYNNAVLQAPGALTGSYEIPAGITEIAGEAFTGCREMTAVSIPNSVTKIGGTAFYQCFGLTSVDVPDSVTELGDYAFYWCTGLTSIDVPKGITRIGEGVFGECYGLTNVVIPDHITEIGHSAFWNCFNMTSITIPDSVTVIDGYAFSWCGALTSVKLSNNLKVIESGLFETCPTLKQVFVPAGITTIKANAFLECTALDTIWYGGTAEEWDLIDIDDEGNGALQNIQLRFMQDAGTCGNGISWLLEKNGVLTISGNGTMNDFDPSAAPWAQYKNSINQVILDAGVTGIGSNAFQNHSALTSVSIAGNLTSIGAGAFAGCTALQAFVIPEGVTAISDGTFAGCSGLQEITVPADITSIGANAFSGCTALAAFSFPNALTKIGAGAFSGCTALASIAIGAQVAEIGENAFSGCSALASITVAQENPAFTTDASGILFNKEKTLLILAPVTFSGSYSIPNSVTEIAANAFCGTGLTDIAIPVSVVRVGESAFRDCAALTSVRYHGTRDQWAAIAFGSGNDQLLNANIVFTDAYGTCGENLTWTLESTGLLTIFGNGSMADYAPESAPWYTFADSIRSLQISSSVTSIGSYAFQSLTALESFEISDSITAVGDGALMGCSNLRSVQIGNGVTQLGDRVFDACKNLKTINVGAQLTVTADTFAYSTSLEAIHISADNPTCSSQDGLVYSKDGTCLVAVPRGRTGTVTLPAGVTSIGSYAFASGNVTGVVLPEGITSIRSYAFRDSQLKELKLPSTVTEIGEKAFANTHIQSLLLPAGISVLGNGAFMGCDQLTSISIPAGLTAIAPETFRNCVALKTITIPANVTSIGANAFDGCSALSMVIYLGEPEAFLAIEVGSGNDILTAATVIPQQTVSVVAAPNPATGKPELQWEAVEGVTKYEIHRATSLTGKYKKLKTVSATSYTDTSASTGSEYFYKIKAVYGKKAVEIGTAVSRCVCAQPKVKVSVSTTTGLPTLSWSKVSGAKTYEILRAESADGEFILLVNQKGTSFTDKTAQADTVYFYKVRIVPTKANTECIDPTPVRVVTLIAKPTLKVSNSANGKPQITCSEVSGAVSYTLFRSTSKKGTFTQLMVSNAPFFVDNTAEVGKTYYYKIQATGKNSTSIQSSYSSVLCRAAMPTLAISRNDTTGKADLTWTAVNGAKKYEVHRATKETGKYSKVATVTTLTYQDTKATPGSNYFYKVYAVPSSSSAKSPASNICSVFALCAQPQLKVTYNSAGQHTISWSKVTGAKTYEILRADSADGEFIRLANQKGTSYVDKNTQPDTIYYYKVNVVASKAGANSVDANPQMIARAISLPTITASNSVDGHPVISWNAVAGAVRYRVYRATSSKGTYTMIGMGTQTSFCDETAALGSRYYYKVSALGVNSESAMSSYKEAYGKLPAPVITEGGQDKASGKPVLRWSAVNGAKKYDVYRATSENGKYSKIKSGLTVLTYTDTGAKNSTTYYYKIVAVSSNSKANSAMGPWYRVTCGNISSKDAAVRALLLKMERYPVYLSYEAELLIGSADLYLSTGKVSYHTDVCNRILNVQEYILKIRSGCGSNVYLKPLRNECDRADFPTGTGNAFVRSAKSYAKDAQRIVTTYNIYRELYGLEKVGYGYS